VPRLLSGVGSNSRPGPEISQAIAAIALRQHGNVTRAQLVDLGLNDNAIAHRAARGLLHPVHRGVYAVGRPARMPLERAAAAVLACGPDAVLSHRSALTLWGIEREWRSPLHVSLIRGDRRPPGLSVHRPANLTRADVRFQLGIRVTSPARTLLDCAPELTRRALVRAVNDARLSRLLTPAQLDGVLARNPVHPGAARLRAVELPVRPTRSPFEDDFARFCEHHGLPAPQLNTTVHGYEVDAFFPEQRLIVELDGWDFHRTRQAFETDRERDAHMLAHGIVTVRITKERLRERPGPEAARLRALLAARLGG